MCRGLGDLEGDSVAVGVGGGQGAVQRRVLVGGGAAVLGQRRDVEQRDAVGDDVDGVDVAEGAAELDLEVERDRRVVDVACAKAVVEGDDVRRVARAQQQVRPGRETGGDGEAVAGASAAVEGAVGDDAARPADEDGAGGGEDVDVVGVAEVAADVEGRAPGQDGLGPIDEAVVDDERLAGGDEVGDVGQAREVLGAVVGVAGVLHEQHIDAGQVGRVEVGQQQRRLPGVLDGVDLVTVALAEAHVVVADDGRREAVFELLQADRRGA